MKCSVYMPYFRDLSNNSYKIPGTYTTKGAVKVWMNELAGKVSKKSIPVAKEYKIVLKGYFKDKRHPDIHNLHKVVGDSLKMVLPVDDKYYLFEDREPVLGNLAEYLVIEIEPREEV